MSLETLEKLVSDFLKIGFDHSNFAWQGGEPALMGLDFYRKAVELQKKYARSSQIVNNSLQTNGTLLNDEWCRFLAENKFLVGISLDGPADLHDYYRIDYAGRGSYERVMAGIENCRRNNVEFNILVLLNDKNVTLPDRLFDFFMDLEIKYLQFIPCAEKDPSTGQIADYSVTPAQYGDFLCKMFDRWYEFGPRNLSIQIFESLLSYYVYGRGTICTLGRRCNDYVVVEHNGDVFCCDFFVEDHWRLGNIAENTIDELFNSPTKREFADLKRHICNQCFVCRYSAMCTGGCLKDRILLADDMTQPSYYCQSYKQLFEHSRPRLMKLSAELISKKT